MHIYKILCIGNNSIETDHLAKTLANRLGKNYNGLFDDVNIIPLNGVYQTSIEDLSIEGINKIINKFDQIEIFDQKNSNDRLAYLQRMTLKNQIDIVDIEYPTIDEKVLFVGCSHTAGVGHHDNSTVYTKLFSDYINKKPLILGNPGKGNYLFEQLLNSYNLRNSQVIIQFTDIFRLRYVNDIGSVVEKQILNFSRPEIEFFTEEKLTQDFLEIVNRIVMRLRDGNTNFLFFQLTHQHPADCLIHYELSKYKEFCWMPEVNQDTASDGIHFGIKSHKHIADKLIARWNKLYAQT
jgi:hypothetical protein